MKNTFKIIPFIFLFFSVLGFAQTGSVNVTMQVLPPYSTYITDYLNNPNKVVFTLTASITQSVRLKATISGDNGITVATSPNYRPPTPILLVPFQPKVMTGIDLKNYIDLNSVTVTGISKDELFRGAGIPEGVYTFCIEVVDYNTGYPLSNPAPMGCSNMFEIQQIPPPQLISPRCDEPITSINPQSVIFSWLPPQGAPVGSRYLFKMVELIPITRNPNEALNSATTPAFYETTTNAFSLVYGPAQPLLRNGRKYAWRVTLLPSASTPNVILNAQNKGNSEVCSFTFTSNEVVQNQPTPSSSTYGIVLTDPINGKKITSGYGLKFQWLPSPNKTVTKYELQFTNSHSQDKKITNWSNLDETLFTNSDAFFASKQVTDLFVNLPPSWTQGTGKIAWRVVGLSNGKVVDKSKIETYEIVEDKSDIANLKGLYFNGYFMQINQVGNKDQDKFSASGKMLLWENGPEVGITVKDVKVRPIVYIAKTKTYQWGIIDGVIEIDVKKAMFPYKKINLATQKDCDGTFTLAMNTIKMIVKTEGTLDAKTNVYKITKDLGSTECKAVGKWFTNWFLPAGQSSSSNMYEIESLESTLKMSFADKFSGEMVLKSDKTIQKLANGDISATFGGAQGDAKLKIAGLQAETSLSGIVTVPNAKMESNNKFGNLIVPFKNQKNLNFPVTFDTPLQWKMNEDESVMANLTSCYVQLSDMGQIEAKFKNYPEGLNFDKFNLDINLPKKANSTKPNVIKLSFDKVYNKGVGYTSNSKPEAGADATIEIAGFETKLKQSSLLINKNKLVYLTLKGDVNIPFINDWAAVWIDIDYKKINTMNIDFDTQKKYTLLKNSSGDEISIRIWSGRIENNAIIVTPNITISKSKRKGLELKDLSLCELYIDPSGAVSFDSNFSTNSESVCEKTKKLASYYNFEFAINKVKIKRFALKSNFKVLFSGDVTLGPNIATTSKKEVGFSYGTSSVMNTAPNTNAPVGNQNYQIPKNYKGPNNAVEHWSEDTVTAVENSASFSDDNIGIQGGYEDGAQKFGGGFKIVQDDPIWGDYFMLDGSYEAKQPDCKKLEAKMILGKKSKIGYKYSYWFFEFYQKGFVTVPIVPGVVEAHGFGGKAYYHMGATYNNVGEITALSPNDKNGLGIVAIADFRTAYDNGATLHGKATIVSQFYGWSLDKIDYYVKGEAIAPNSESAGLLQARLRGSLNWVDKYIDGKGQIWGGVKDIVCINEGQANEDAINFHFGADDFFINVGSKESPITAEVLCGNGWSTGVWMGFDTQKLSLGFVNEYDSGWKGLNLGVASAQGRLTSSLSASMTINYSPFQATGTASFNGRAYGKGCVDFYVFSGCIGGSCGAAANLTVTMPNPVAISGSVRCDVHRYIPDFTLHAAWSSTSGFSISL